MRFHFEGCVLDTETRELLRDGTVVHISPKAFQLLQALIAARPRALSKTELQERLWPQTYVLEANLPNLVAEVRAAVRDDARKPRCVRTVHRFGYAFSADAREEARQKGRDASSPFLYRLIWAAGPVVLVEGDHLLGRDVDSVIDVDSHSVSRRHALLHISKGSAVLEDLGSKNGTYVRGEKLTGPARLADGDEFRLGSVPLTFRILPAPGFNETEG